MVSGSLRQRGVKNACGDRSQLRRPDLMTYCRMPLEQRHGTPLRKGMVHLSMRELVNRVIMPSGSHGCWFGVKARLVVMCRLWGFPQTSLCSL
uniref:Uncharacterized protein n=2 Tax=Anguilla anguilla TaxID=7936 RepID=A0A0E9RWF3_ANGAN